MQLQMQFEFAKCLPGHNLTVYSHATSTFSSRGDLSHSRSQWTSDLLFSEGFKLSLQSQPVCDQWTSQEVDVIDLANGRVLKKASEEGSLGPKTLNQSEDWLVQSYRREGPSTY